MNDLDKIKSIAGLKGDDVGNYWLGSDLKLHKKNIFSVFFYRFFATRWIVKKIYHLDWEATVNKLSEALEGIDLNRRDQSEVVSGLNRIYEWIKNSKDPSKTELLGRIQNIINKKLPVINSDNDSLKPQDPQNPKVGEAFQHHIIDGAAPKHLEQDLLVIPREVERSLSEEEKILKEIEVATRGSDELFLKCIERIKIKSDPKIVLDWICEKASDPNYKEKAKIALNCIFPSTDLVLPYIHDELRSEPSSSLWKALDVKKVISLMPIMNELDLKKYIRSLSFDQQKQILPWVIENLENTDSSGIAKKVFQYLFEDIKIHSFSKQLWESMQDEKLIQILTKIKDFEDFAKYIQCSNYTKKKNVILPWCLRQCQEKDKEFARKVFKFMIPINDESYKFRTEINAHHPKELIKHMCSYEVEGVSFNSFVLLMKEDENSLLQYMPYLFSLEEKIIVNDIIEWISDNLSAEKTELAKKMFNALIPCDSLEQPKKTKKRIYF